MSCHETCGLMLTNWLLHLWPAEAGGRRKAVGKKQEQTISADFPGGPTSQLLIDLISQLIYFGSFLDARNLRILVLLWMSLQKKKIKVLLVTEKGRVDTLQECGGVLIPCHYSLYHTKLLTIHARKCLPLVALTFELITELSLDTWGQHLSKITLDWWKPVGK